jgi:HD-GYP domain-containing protein (c-di-GMP phosphodiesterase class II)
MPKTPYSEALKVIDAITSDMDKTTLLGVNVSVSLGLACQKVESSNIDIIKEAEIDMYNKKLFEISSKRSETIKTILATLHLKNPREESHSRRVSELCQSIGEILQMRKDQLNLLRTMGNLHDIGKIAIDEVILNKAGKLTDDEWSKVKRHPEIGYRILATAVEYADIAEDILAHHERWDGKGYPKGLKGEEIPLRARIIAIADAYDAMTSSRPYRPALTEDYASAEIIKNAGIQFDPDIAFKFVTEYLHRDWSNNKTIT